MAKILGRTAILGSKDLKFLDVSCPEWAPEEAEFDGVVRALTEEEKSEYCVRIRNLTGVMRGKFIAKGVAVKVAQHVNREAGKEVMQVPVANPEEDRDIEMLLVSMSACDEEGNLIFSEDDIKELGKKSAAPIARCSEAAQKLAGLTASAKMLAEKK